MIQDTRKTRKEKGKLCFHAAFDTGEEACVVLLKKGTDEVLGEIPFRETPYCGTVREAVAEGVRADRTEYVYKVGGRVMIDPEAKLILGRKPFGDRSERSACQVRCGFPKQDFDWGEAEHALRLPYEDTVAYYLHVRGFTMNKNSKVRHRGTFRGLEEKIPYLKDLGINQVVLMPAYEFEEIQRAPEPQGAKGAPAGAAAQTAAGAASQMTEGTAVQTSAGAGAPTGKLNYWGYTESWYFAPKAGYCAGREPDVEFKTMVRAMHEAGIEVVMEFAFPDHVPADRSLRALIWWVREYHVDGFLLLCRDQIALMAASCPALRYTKLLHGYFDPARIYPKGRKIPFRNLANCNDGFKIDCRRLLKGDENQLPSFVSRVRQNGQDVACVNYLCGHDGFTLMDLVSYEKKYNEENGEQNRDGAETEFSWNCGAEGPTKKRLINLLRMRQMRNAFAMLLLSQGTPMLLAGDEMGNSQNGNNNPYCIDSEVTWVDWNTGKCAQQLQAYVKDLIALRKEHKIFHSSQPCGQTQIGYPEFSCHSEKAWYGDFEYQNRHVGMMYSARREGTDEFLYVGWNFHWDEKTLALPYLPDGMCWKSILDTAGEEQAKEGPQKYVREFTLPGRSVCVLAGVADEDGKEAWNRQELKQKEKTPARES